MGELEYQEHFAVLEKSLSHKIEAMQKELTGLRQKIEALQSQEANQLREIAELESAISIFRRAFDISGSLPPTNGFDLHRYRTQTVGESAFEIMRAKGGKTKVTEILRLLTDAGKLSDYTKGYSTVKKTLDRDHRFRKTKPGEYKLADTGA